MVAVAERARLQRRGVLLEWFTVTWNVLEAARRVGVKRFIYTSSLMVVWGYEPPAWVASDAPPRPVGTYALTKRLGETMCEHFAGAHGMSVVM